MADKKSNRQEFIEDFVKWFTLDQKMSGYWKSQIDSRPKIYAVKDEEGSFYWIEVDFQTQTAKQLNHKNAMARIAKEINRLNMNFDLNSSKKEQIKSEIVEAIRAFEPGDKLGIVFDDEILPIGFSDENFAFQKLPFKKPNPQLAEEPGKIEYQYYPLGEYWDGLKKRMVDYNPETDQSKHFELFAMMLAETFLSNEPSKAVMYLYGSPDAGKTTMIEDIGSLLGNAYKKVSLKELKKDTGRALLPGVRLAFSDEAPRGDTMDAELKAVTGAPETLDGRHLYGDRFDFKNTMILWVTSNHRPLVGHDAAILARYRILELGAIPKEDRIKDKFKRRALMMKGLEAMLQLGASLLMHYGEIPENDQETTDAIIEEELEDIQFYVNQAFVYDKDSISLTASELTAWIKRDLDKSIRHKVNKERVEQALERIARPKGSPKPYKQKPSRKLPNGSRPYVWYHVRRKSGFEIMREEEHSKTLLNKQGKKLSHLQSLPNPLEF